MSAKIKTRTWDAAEHLRDEEDIRLYIEAAQEEASDDAAFMAAVLGTVARARNMAELARETGVARETLYKVMRGEGNPTLETVGKLAKALGFRLGLVPIPDRAPELKEVLGNVTGAVSPKRKPVIVAAGRPAGSGMRAAAAASGPVLAENRSALSGRFVTGKEHARTTARESDPRPRPGKKK